MMLLPAWELAKLNLEYSLGCTNLGWESEFVVKLKTSALEADHLLCVHFQYHLLLFFIIASQGLGNASISQPCKQEPKGDALSLPCSEFTTWV
jgi:hypothetical protein